MKLPINTRAKVYIWVKLFIKGVFHAQNLLFKGFRAGLLYLSQIIIGGHNPKGLSEDLYAPSTGTTIMAMPCTVKKWPFQR